LLRAVQDAGAQQDTSARFGRAGTGRAPFRRDRVASRTVMIILGRGRTRYLVTIGVSPAHQEQLAPTSPNPPAQFREPG
jgi:hypothetical protein